MPNNNLYNAMHMFYFHHQKEKKRPEKAEKSGSSYKRSVKKQRILQNNQHIRIYVIIKITYLFKIH